MLRPPTRRRQSMTDEEFKQWSVFQKEFLLRILNTAVNDEEKQFIGNAFRETYGNHESFCMMLFDLDWFLEIYELIFEETKYAIKDIAPNKHDIGLQRETAS